MSYKIYGPMDKIVYQKNCLLFLWFLLIFGYNTGLVFFIKIRIS